VPHVELSLSEPPARATTPVESSLDRWTVAVADAVEASLIIDDDEVIVAMSPSCYELLGLRKSAVGRELLDVLGLLDFGPEAVALTGGEVAKIPPLLALTSGRLARGLLRVRCAKGACTLDAIATPLLDESGEAIGSLTFFSQV